MRAVRRVSALLLGLPLVLALPARAEDPLMGKSPWSFSYQNRAAIAVAIKNMEDPGSGSGGAGTIVCGGTSGASGEGSNGSGASATANSSCIIINNSDGAVVHNDQISDGDQTATSESSTAPAKAAGPKAKGKVKKKPASGGSIDEVSSVLYGHKQGL
jgi:hypothetical protein